MKNLSRIVSVVLVLGAGVAVAWVDTRPGWDDTGVTAIAVLSVAAAGPLARLPAWLAALCAAGPLLAAELPGGLGVLLSVPFALAGAYAVAFVRKHSSGTP